MKAHRWLITLTACLLIFAVLAGYKYTQIQAAIAFGKSFPEPSESVQALVVEEGPIQHFAHTIGEVVAPEQMMLRNELAGRLTEVNMVSGQTVKKGQVLVQQAVADDRARLKAAEANARLAELKLNRMQRLLKTNTTSQDNVDQAQAEYDMAAATVAELKAVIDKKTLVAPFDARVGLHDLEPGEYLDANTELVELVGLRDYLWVDFNLPLAQGSADIGDTVQINFPDSANGEIDAVVIAKSPALSAQSRNLRYRAKVSTASDIPPNAVVDVLVPTGNRIGIEVPTPAVLRDQIGSYVFKLVAEDEGQGYRAQRQSIKLGREREQKVSVVEGLEPGTLIATDGAFKLHHGMLAYTRTRPKSEGDAPVDTSSAGNSGEANGE